MAHRRMRMRATVAGLAVAACAMAGAGGAAASGTPPADATATPIKHVIVIVGENHTFDNVYATYRPPSGQHVMNLLSEGIVTASGKFGTNVGKARQFTAIDTSKDPGHYSVTPRYTGAYHSLPQPDTTYVDPACSGGQPSEAPDGRFPAHLPNGPFQITHYVAYADIHQGHESECLTGAYVGDPLHRFYQMNQQVNAGANHLWVWNDQTAGDSNGAPPSDTHQGGLAMGYYNVLQGDAPVMDYLARNYAMSDNYHQAVMGGTGANHAVLGFGVPAWYQNSSGAPTTPPSNEIENPNPLPGTNNWFTQDGYSGGSYSDCSDPSAPGVAAVLGHLHDVHPGASSLCAPSTYYLLNNYNPGYLADGTVDHSEFAVPPQHEHNIAQELNAHHVSWAYYGQGWNNGNPDLNQYCNICNPYQYMTSVMTNPTQRAKIHDLDAFESAAAAGTLPDFSIVKPEGNYDGHPAYSTLAQFEAFTSTVLSDVARSPDYKSTVVFVTMDEGGGYYDSGYIQPVSFFGDGTRVPMIAVSPYTKPGAIDHTYTDHASILKFVEANWHLPALGAHTLDALPNPRTHSGDPYVPVNGPAIGNLMTLFDFNRSASQINADRTALLAETAPRALPAHPNVHTHVRALQALR
ncbi:MAG: alkaline phosphatase family protein [Gaiellales bacterium]